MGPSLQSFQASLQDAIVPDDQEWIYSVKGLPEPSKLQEKSLVKSISVASDASKQCIALRLDKHSPNRAIDDEALGRFVTISFQNFRLQYPPTEPENTIRQKTEPATPKASADYVVRLLRSGVNLNGFHYNFYGHSNSQLKSRTCFLFAGTKEEISRRIEGLGDLTKIKSVAKKAKRIGLLFSSAKVATQLAIDRYEDIPDVRKDDYIFTDGCGLISTTFAKLLVQRLNIHFRNQKYLPTVYQIRYRGYKGVLTVDSSLRGKTLVHFRESMKKVSGGSDLSFCVVEYSKPYGLGFLNDEIILLLHSLGITSSILLKKQQEHLDLLAGAMQDPRIAFQFLSYLNEPGLAERVLMEGLESLKGAVQKLVGVETNRMLNKREEQRCRILVKSSRLIFGVCDPRGLLKEGECALKLTMVEDGVPKTIVGTEVLVTRNPCLHPGDLQKLKAVQHEELSHLVDCIVFPTKGRRPSADMMSGGDLDGDKFFVCWDPDLIPSKIAIPASYKGPPEPVSFKKITDDDRLVYFAQYTNASLGRVKNLYLDWARLSGPMSSQCQELNYLYSHCVDGNRIRIPIHLESPPKPDTSVPKFILDVLHEAAKTSIHSALQPTNINSLPCDGLELLLSKDEAAFSEFELFRMTANWCFRNNASLEDFLGFFNFDQMSDDQRVCTMAQFPYSKTMPALMMNGLMRSNILSQEELQQFKLNLPGMRWKRVFDSSTDRLGRFMEVTSRALELFHRKIIVLHLSARLSIAIYVPKRIEKYCEAVVDDAVRLFSVPHSQGRETAYRQALPTKVDYRLYTDDAILQLYEKQRSNTWIFLRKPGTDDATYRNFDDKGDKRRQRNTTVEAGLNSDFVASVALGKFSSGLARHIGRVNRDPILGAELYVISNRDVRSLQVLDQWLEFIDTRETMPIFDDTGQEYEGPSTKGVDWSAVPEHIRFVAQDQNFATFRSMESDQSKNEVFEWLLAHGLKSVLRKAFEYILSSATGACNTWPNAATIKTMIDFLPRASFLALVVVRIGPWDQLPVPTRSLLNDRGADLLSALTLVANQMQILVVEPFRVTLSQMSHMSLKAFGELVELISLVVRSSETALDLLVGCLELESSRLLTARPKIVQYFVQNCICVAMEHIEESDESRATRDDLLIMTLESKTGLVKSRVRIDSHSSVRLSTNDHIQLTASTLPRNSLETSLYSMDALIERSEPGMITIRSLHPLPPFLEDCSWKVKSCGSYVTTKTMFEALSDFVLAPEQSCAIFDKIVDIESQPYLNKTSPPVSIQERRDLNESQKSAVTAVWESPLTCLWGPPGTGKTHTIAVILEILCLEKERRLLVTAPTHNAVDNVMRKYLDNMRRQGVPATSALRVSTDVRKVAEDLRKYTCDAMMGKDLNENPAGRKKAQTQIKECRLIFTTCIGAGLGLLRSETFDTVIIDEASQQTEPQSLVPLVKGCSKAILVGDHVQLSATAHPTTLALGFDVSLFERLYTSPNSGTRLRKVMLDTQYRMQASICAFSSREFYEGRLRTAVLESNRSLTPSSFPWPSRQDGKLERMFFIQCNATEDIGRKSKSNAGQAALTALLCKKLLQQDEGAERAEAVSIAALAPYSRQVDILKGTLGSGVIVNSIDGFQGREADVVLFVTTRCNAHRDIGFLKDMRRLNVVLTRARSACIILGDQATLVGGSPDERATGVWRRLLGCATILSLE